MLRDSVGQERFDQALGDPGTTVPHDLADQLWFEGAESLRDRLRVAVEVFRLMPTYSQLMYWPYSQFDDATRLEMWAAYRSFLDDPSDAVADPVAYSLWVDYFDDSETVGRAWREVSGPQEPRRPRLDRVLPASGPVPWPLKAPLYESLAVEGGWDDALIEGLYGSCVDIYGQLERTSARRLLERLHRRNSNETVARMRASLEIALADRELPELGPDRRSYVVRVERHG